MTKTFELEIVTQKRTVYKARVASLVAPGAQGRFGVLVRHAPMISGLSAGVLRIKDEVGRERSAFVGNGLLMVEKSRVVILAGQAEMEEEIDVERAAASGERARKRLRQRDAGLDVQRARASLSRALTRLRIAGVD